MKPKQERSVLGIKVLELHRYNKEDGWVMPGVLLPDFNTVSQPYRDSPTPGCNDDAKENSENCVPISAQLNLKPAAKVGNRAGLGDAVSKPNSTRINTNKKKIVITPFTDDNNDCSTYGSFQEISVYDPPKDLCVSWCDDFQITSYACLPLPSAKAVTSQAQEISHWVSAVNQNFAQVVLKDIGLVDLNQTNLTLDTSPFAIACLQGDVATVQRAIGLVCANLKPPYSRQNRLRLLLEAHESGSWSPLLLIACAMVEDKNMAHNPSLLTVAALLLQAGARPDAQDALGKSIVHYAAGCDATPMSMRFVDMCISAAKSVNLYGKEVVLNDLTTTHLNGKKGIVGGYDYLTSQRSVFVPSFGKEVWVPAENIRLANGKGQDKRQLLVDLQDHNGNTVLHEILKSNREEIAHSLLHRYHASIHIKNNDGTTPAMMTLLHPTNNVGQMICDFTRSEADKVRDAKKKQKNICANCSKSLGKGGMKCTKCLVALYCSPRCQTQHWKQGCHRLECTRLAFVASGVKLSCKHLDHEMTSSGSLDFFGDSYVKPIEIQNGQKFVVAVQINPDTKSLMIFSVCDGCQFQYHSTGPGYYTIVKEVQKEAAWDGCKTYMKASFDANGDCTMYPTTACVKTAYWW
ncbi:unnamed protein product [Cylindrotheca closterium]|uniref:MYND-type domain-containing protein n=1 Tax=Cylindrotheca closterium TaxID=2856 RepID=A0AAD2G1P1_9STRA|nr:unnamed protein product [Cylindrotheca closterium]